MTSPDFAVLQVERLVDVLKYVLERHIAPSTLIVCSTKDAFEEALKTDFALPAPEGPSEQPAIVLETRRLWTTPTLRLLSSSRTVKLVFCPDITHLRAYLATYSIAVSTREPEAATTLRMSEAAPMLAIFNPIQLHRPTSAFSAQGLNRTFAIAVEAAHATSSRLVLAECPAVPDASEQPLDDDPAPTLADPWDEELSILNVTTKRLSEMAVGRTVKARTIAERWCVFESLPDQELF